MSEQWERYSSGSTTEPQAEQPKQPQPGKILRITPSGRVIDDIVARYDRGEVVGQVTAVKTKDGGFIVMYDDSLSYVEKLGLIEAVKTDIMGRAMGVPPWTGGLP